MHFQDERCDIISISKPSPTNSPGIIFNDLNAFLSAGMLNVNLSDSLFNCNGCETRISAKVQIVCDYLIADI